MKTRFILMLARCRTLSDGAKSTFLEIVGREEAKATPPSLNTLATVRGIVRSSIQLHLAELMKWKLISPKTNREGVRSYHPDVRRLYKLSFANRKGFDLSKFAETGDTPTAQVSRKAETPRSENRHTVRLAVRDWCRAQRKLKIPVEGHAWRVLYSIGFSYGFGNLPRIVAYMIANHRKKGLGKMTLDNLTAKAGSINRILNVRKR